MKPEQIKVIEKAIKVFGPTNQTEMMIEECSELILAIQKAKRYPNYDSIKNLISEIADVKIMIEQMILIYNKTGDVDKEIEIKLYRLESNLPPI